VTRASDGDRERALVALRGHYAAGRIDAAELEERVAGAARARYRDELARLLADLPRERGARAAGFLASVDRMILRVHLGTYLAVNAMLIGIWGLAGSGDFWPAWVIVPWGAALAGHAWCSRTLRRVLRLPRRRAA
jgi:hypothetical protein